MSPLLGTNLRKANTMSGWGKMERPEKDLHELAAAAMQAEYEYVAVRVEVKEGEYFVTTRNRIRRTLIEDGIAGEIEKLVEKLLGPV